MGVLKTIAAAFSMFSAVPVPPFPWKEPQLRWLLCAFPLVGAAAGLTLWAWENVWETLSFPPILWGAGACLLPVWITGGIHLDGYADVWDALSSNAVPKRRREILRDPRCGAFAVIRLCTYFAASLALWTALEPDGRTVLCMALAFILSRALSGLLLLVLPVAEGSNLAEAFQSHAAGQAKPVLAVETALASAGVLAAGGVCGVLMLAAAGLAVWRYARTARLCFGGTSGDLAGWFLQRAELWMLAALTLGQYMGW